jgi:hypothetical protein
VAGDVNKMLGQAYLRLSAALLVEVFGPPEAREKVGALLDHKLSGDEAESVRQGLDAVARDMFGS